MPRVLQVVKDQHAYATVIAPHWPTQPWYRRLQKMEIAPPVPTTMSPKAILASIRKLEPLGNKHWTFLAWRVYGGNNNNNNNNNALIMRHLSRQAYSEAQKHET